MKEATLWSHFQFKELSSFNVYVNYVSIIITNIDIVLKLYNIHINPNYNNCLILNLDVPSFSRFMNVYSLL